MKKENEMKIYVLKEEICDAQCQLEICHAKMETLLCEIKRYESNKKDRDEELRKFETEIEKIKNSIPDFSEETYKHYAKCYEIQQEYEQTSKFYGEIDTKIEKQKAKLEELQSSISNYNKRIDNVQKAIKDLESKENN